MPVARACAPAKPYRHAGPCADPQPRSPAAARSKRYNPRHPERMLLYRAVAGHLESGLALSGAGQFDGQGDPHPPPTYVEQAFRKTLECGQLGPRFCAGVVRGRRERGRARPRAAGQCAGWWWCGGSMRILAFITEGVQIRGGSRSTSVWTPWHPPIAPARGCRCGTGVMRRVLMVPGRAFQSTRAGVCTELGIVGRVSPDSARGRVRSAHCVVNG